MRKKYAIVQLGAHRGDEAFESATSGAPCLLVEPVSYLFNSLKSKYSGFPNVFLERAAISDKPGKATIYYFSNVQDLPFWADQIASLDKNHLLTLGRQSGFPLGFEKLIAEDNVQAIVFMDLMNRYSVGEIDLLYIDTEGLDASILLSIDFTKIKINQIIFERKHTDGVRTTGYVYNKTLAFLERMGFHVTHMDHQNDVATLTADWKFIRLKECLSKLSNFSNNFARSFYYGLKDILTTDKGNVRCGILYLAIGKECFFEVQRSIATVRQNNPSVPVTVFTDQHFKIRLPADYRYIKSNKSPFKLKVDVMAMSPYEFSLFLDSDTFVICSLDTLFELVRSYDFCIANGPSFEFFDGSFRFNSYCNNHVFNTGVIDFNHSHNINALFDLWKDSMSIQDDRYVSAGRYCDQWYFNTIVKNSKLFKTLNVCLLDNRIWNLRTYALGHAIKDNQIVNTCIIHGKAWESQVFWRIDLIQFIKERLGTSIL